MNTKNEAVHLPAAPAPTEQPKLVIALPDYETRRIVIVSDEAIDDERVVCVAIEDAAEPVPHHPIGEQRDYNPLWYLKSSPQAPTDAGVRDAAIEEAAKSCDFNASWAKGEADDDQNRPAVRHNYRERQRQSESDAAAIRALKSPQAGGQNG